MSQDTPIGTVVRFPSSGGLKLYPGPVWYKVLWPSRVGFTRGIPDHFAGCRFRCRARQIIRWNVSVRTISGHFPPKFHFLGGVWANNQPPGPNPQGIIPVVMWYNVRTEKGKHLNGA